MSVKEKDPTVAWDQYHNTTIEQNELDELLGFMSESAPWSLTQERHKILEKLGGLSSQSSFLDAGSGTGKMALAEAVWAQCKVTLFDYSMGALVYSRGVLEAYEEKHGPLNADFCQGDLMNMPFEGAFDVVCNEGVIEHWEAHEDRLRTVQQMRQAAKPGGKVVILVPNKSNPFYREWIKTIENVPDEWAFTTDELKAIMEEAGLEDVYAEGFRPHKTFIQYLPIFSGVLRFLAGGLWLLERLMPNFVYQPYARKWGHFIVAVGTRPI